MSTDAGDRIPVTELPVTELSVTELLVTELSGTEATLLLAALTGDAGVATVTLAGVGVLGGFVAASGKDRCCESDGCDAGGCPDE